MVERTELALLRECGECGECEEWWRCRARSVRARCADVSSRAPRGTAASSSRDAPSPDRSSDPAVLPAPTSDELDLRIHLLGAFEYYVTQFGE